MSVHDLWDIIQTSCVIIVFGLFTLTQIFNIPIEIRPRNPKRGSFWIKKD